MARSRSTLAPWILAASLPSFVLTACGDDAGQSAASGSGGQGEAGDASVGGAHVAGRNGAAGAVAKGGQGGDGTAGTDTGGMKADGGTGAGTGGVSSDAGAGANAGGAGADAGAAGADAGGAGADKSWRDAELIEQDDVYTAGPPAVAFDGAGNATALWWQKVSGTQRIVGNHFDAGSEWGTAAPFDTSSTASGDADIVFEPSGDGVAVWVAPRDGVLSVKASRFVGGAWQPSEFIDTVDSGSARLPKVALNASGDAAVVWEKDGDASAGARNDIWAARYSTETGWSPAEPLESDDTGGAERPQVGIDDAGNVVAVWAQRDASYRKNVWFNSHTGNSWDTADLLESSDSSADDPQIAMHGSGDAIVVWVSTYVWSRRYSAATSTWTEPYYAAGSVTASMPQIGMDADGNALVVWRQDSGGDPASIYWNRYSPGADWTAPAPVEQNLSYGASEPDLAVNASGDAVAVWLQFDGVRTSIRASRYVTGESWRGVQDLESSSQSAFAAQVALDASGDAVAVWKQVSGLENIWSNRFR